MTTILLADNSPVQLSYIADIIEEGGFEVVRATNTEEARQALLKGKVAVAVLDLRLTDEGDKMDISGLRLAQEVDSLIPKIIVSSFATKAELVDALQVTNSGAPTVTAFVVKKEVKHALLPAIDDALKLRRAWLAAAQNSVASQLNQDYQEARRDARIHYVVSSVITVGFALLIFWGAMRLHEGTEGGAAWGLLSGVAAVLVAEITNYLMGRRLEFLVTRVEKFHAELLATNRFEQLLEASASIRSETDREAFKRELMIRAADNWLGGDARDRSKPKSS